jgi:hypothetical protein
MIAIKGTERVLICPLGWGLGHASRVIPIISHLIKRGCTVIFAGDESSLTLLNIRFPKNQSIYFPSISVRFSKKGSFFSLFVIALKVIKRTISENRELQKIINQHKIDLVISDNRYGLYSEEIPSVLITHQLHIVFPKPFHWFESIGEWYVLRYANRFTECWVPDNPEGFRLSGELSQPNRLPGKIKFIGLLSRFYGHKPVEVITTWDLVAIVSGPPPHRDIFESELVDIANRLNLKTLIIQGLPLESNGQVKGMATLAPHLPDGEMANAILSAKFVICRSGYSTVMDLLALGRNALLIPTPGQTEQEYLAEYFAKNRIFKKCIQSDLDKLTFLELKEIQEKDSYKLDCFFFI